MIALPPDQKSYFCLPKEQVEEVANLFEKAEQCIKDIEHDGEGLDIPSINELRYFAWHLLKALTSNNLDELNKAKNHAKRAIYDACEAQIVANLTAIAQFKNDYRLINVTEVIKNFTDLMIAAENARIFIKDRNGESREDYYEKCQEHVVILENINTVLAAARNDLNVKIADKRTQSFRYFLTISVTIFLAILAATVTVLTKRP